jgi:hypothetical protein
MVVVVEVIVLVLADVVFGRDEEELLFPRPGQDKHHLATPMVQTVPNKKPANAEFREDKEELVIVGNSSTGMAGGYSWRQCFHEKFSSDLVAKA